MESAPPLLNEKIATLLFQPACLPATLSSPVFFAVKRVNCQSKLVRGGGSFFPIVTISPYFSTEFPPAHQANFNGNSFKMQGTFWAFDDNKYEE